MCIEKLYEKYGDAITPDELGKYFQLDPRTIKKYAHNLGGVEVAPGKWRFLTKKVMEVIDAEQYPQKWKKTNQSNRNGKGGDKVETLPGCDKKIVSGSLAMGRRSPKTAGKGDGADRFGVFDNS